MNTNGSAPAKICVSRTCGGATPFRVVRRHRHWRRIERRLDIERYQNAEHDRIHVEYLQQRQEDRDEDDDDLRPFERPAEKEDDALREQQEFHPRQVHARDRALDELLPAEVGEYRGEGPRADEQERHHRRRARGQVNRFREPLEVQLRDSRRPARGCRARRPRPPRSAWRGPTRSRRAPTGSAPRAERTTSAAPASPCRWERRSAPWAAWGRGTG